MKVQLNTAQPYQNQSFGSLSGTISNGLRKIGESKPVVKVVEHTVVKMPGFDWCAKNMNPRDLSAIAGIWLSGFYAFRTMKDKSIEPERKETLMWNMLITTALATIGGYTIDKGLNKFIKNAQNIFEAKHGSALGKSFRSMCSLAIFTFMYRFLSPIVATPLADKFTKCFLHKPEKNKSCETKKA